MAERDRIDIAYSRALGVHFQQLRDARGLSQEQVAHDAGISRNYYQLLERGLSNRERESPANPTLSMLLALAETFGVDLTELLLADAEPGEHRRRQHEGVEQG